MKNRRGSAILMIMLLLAGLAGPQDARGASVQDIGYVYIRSSAAYLTVGESVVFQVMMPEDVSGFTFEYSLYHRPEGEAFNRYEMIDQALGAPPDTYIYTPGRRGAYLLEVKISDRASRAVKLRSEPYYAYDRRDQNDSSTLPGKVKAIAAQLRGQKLPTTYDKALWMHDWLTANADYDGTKPVFSPEGVLLQGSGVCDSYALAYRILLHEIGIEALYVTGTSRNMAHAWNLVDIDGQWVHVDVTWDDPVGGGNEGRDYFGMNDELISRDHDWNDSNFVPPAANTLEYYSLLVNGATPIFSETQVNRLLSLSLGDKQQVVEYTYLGIDLDFDVNLAIRNWMDLNYIRYFIDSYQQSGSSFSGRIDITYQNLDSFSPFKDYIEFSTVMDVMIKNKRPVIKMYYVGEDESFNFKSVVNDWFATNHSTYGVKSIQFSYSSLVGEIILEYGN